MSTTDQLDTLYQQRFPGEDRRQKDAIWKVLCHDYFQRFVDPAATVVDIGAGYCEFINHIVAGRKIAVDANPDVRSYAGPDVEVINASCDAIDQVGAASVDVVFMSNFLEHLPDKAAVLAVMHECFRILRPGGRVIVLQPNIRYVSGAYWDFFDHHTPLTDRSLVEGLQMAGFRPELVHARFLPYTTKSRLPKAPLLVKLYLKVPALWRLFGAQALVVAAKPETDDGAGRTDTQGASNSTSASRAVASETARPARRAPLALLLAVAVVAYLLIFSLGAPPTAPGLDPAWTEVLGWAFLHDVQWGRELIFTYGPLGFLQPYASYVDGIFSWYAAGQIVMPAAFVLTLCLLLRRSSTLLVLAFLGTYVVICGQLAGDVAWTLTLGFGTAWLIRAGGERLTVGWGIAAVVLAPAFAAVALTKFTLFALWIVCIAAIAAVQFAAGRWRVALLLMGGFLAAMLLVWVAAGQHLANLPAFVATGFEVARGYPHAMGDHAPLLHEMLGLVVTGLYLLGCALVAWHHRHDVPRLAVAAISALIGLLFWLACFVRGDHWAGYYPSIALLPFALLADPRTAAARFSRLLLAAVVVLAVVVERPHPGLLTEAVARVRNATYNLTHLQNLAQIRKDQWRSAAAKIALPKVRQKIGNSRVDMLTWEQGVLLLNGLNYAPRPVFQSYAAFTPGLARRNEAYFLGPQAPPFVLLKLDYIDGRVPTMEDALALVALIKLYHPVLAEHGFLLLERDATAQAQPVQEDGTLVESKLGRDLHVPAGGQPTLAFVHIELNPFGRLYTLLFREPALYLTRHTIDGKVLRQRLVRPTAGSGFMISPVVESNSDWVKLYASQPLRAVDRISIDVESKWTRMAFLRRYTVSWQTFAPLHANNSAASSVVLGMNMLYPGFNIAPSAESNEYRTVFEDGQESLFLHAPATLEFRPAAGRYGISAISGVQRSAVADPGCARTGADGIGVSFLLSHGDSESMLLHRDLNPFRRLAEGGAQQLSVDDVDIAAGDRVIYRVDPGPTNANVACDWSYVRDLVFEPRASPASYPGFNVLSSTQGLSVVDEGGKQAVFLQATSGLTVLPADGHYQVSATYGVRDVMVRDPSCKRLNADGIGVSLVRRRAGRDFVLWHGELDPFHQPADAGPHKMSVASVDLAVGDKVSWHVDAGRQGNSDCDWSYLRDLRFDPVAAASKAAGRH